MDAPINFFESGIRIFTTEIDLFATNIIIQFVKYAAFRPDPGAMYIDAFNIDCSDLKFYTFPPISAMSRVLSKVKEDTCIQPCLQCWYRLQFY